MNSEAFLSGLIVPQLDFESGRADEKFCRFFTNLYRIPLYKDGLDLILTKLQKRQLRFEIKITRDWDTNLGCYLSSENNVFDQKLGKFLRKKCEKIVLRSFSYNVLAHEMAHACEFNSNIDLGEEFRKAMAIDMKNRCANNLALDGEIQRLMIEQLAAYKPHQILSELFARYFELLSLSRLVSATGAFDGNEVVAFFANTSNFIAKIFNPQIHKIIDPSIAKATAAIINEVKISKAQHSFSDQIESQKQKSSNSWSRKVKSNDSWFQSFQNHSKISDKSS